MKYLVLVFSCLLLVGCSPSKKEETKTKETSSTVKTTQTSTQLQPSSSSNESNSTSSVENVSTEEITATTPELLRGTWVNNEGTNNLEITVTENSIITQDQEYKITSYAQDNNTYTIMWDIESVSNPGNPQPFIFTYIPESDEMSSGMTYQRK